MKQSTAWGSGLVVWLVVFTLGMSQSVIAGGNSGRAFGKGHPFQLNELPAGNLKAKLEKLPPQAKEKAMAWLHSFTFSEFDAAEHLRVDKDGGIFYMCPDNHGRCDGHTSQAALDNSDSANGDSGSSEPKSSVAITADSGKEAGPTISAAAVPVSSPPVYDSKPGAPYHIYIDVNGGHVPNTTAWGGPAGGWDCRPWSPNDSDETTFSDTEQANIRRIWERIAEDYSSFNVNVTTNIIYDPEYSGPGAYTGSRNDVGWLMVTPTTDANGSALPHNGAGGVAYVGVFGNSNFYSTYQPAWTTPMGVANTAEAASHEMGHNMGLSHDGTSSLTYYGGHAATASAPSWGPIMGTGYNRNVSQWCQGEYFDANRTQDDLAIIAGRVTFRTDDHGNDNANASELTVLGDGSFSQDGIIEQTGEVDVFSFATGAGSITVNVDPYRCDSQTWGGNLDAILELYNTGGTLIASSNPLADVKASITTTVAAGTYFVHIKPTGAGDPMNTTRSGYTVYGSVGQYTVSGTCILPGVGVLESAGTTDVTEGGATDTYTLQLGTTPSADVTVTITPDSQVSVDKTSVTFTPSNWSTPQTVTVTAVNDTTEEGPHTGTITHTSSSTDSAFNGIGVASVVANITDNDYIEVTSPNGGETWLADTTQSITWFSLMGGNVKIDLLKNSTYLSTIIDSTPNSGSYNWTIPANQTPGLNYQVRITSVETPATSDASDTDFNIVPQPTEFYYEPLDSNPGWNLGTGWAYGTPGGNNEDGIGLPAPTSGAIGTNVIGYALSGDYEAGITSTRYATTTAIDCSNYANIKLQFQRWLGVEEPAYDHAYIHVSSDGSTWNQVWANGATVDDNSWNLVEYDISAFADTQATVYIRWGMGTTDGSWNYCGWNIDEIKLFGSSLTPTSGVTITQTGGSTDVAEGGASDSYSLVLLSQPSADVTVTIGTDAQVTASVPSVTFTTGNWNVEQTVTVNAVDDGAHELAHTGSILHTASSTDTSYDGIGVDGVLVNITDNDNNAPTVTTTPFEQTVYLDGAPAADPVAGASIFLDAGLDDGANATWEDSLGLWSPSINSGVTFAADAGSSLTGITSAYVFPGGVSGAAGCDGPALQDMGVDTQPITLEIWFKPAASASYPANGQILWETGGGTGLGIFYNNGFVETAHDSNQAQLSADVSALTGEFIQVVVTYDTTSASNNFNLYINGELKDSGSRSDGDMCGGDDSGLGNRGQSNAGGAGSGDANTESFEGQIAIFRSYHNRVLTSAEVLQNYNSIAGSGVDVTLTGTANDLDGDPLTTTWTRESGPAEVSIVDPAALVTTATFTVEGDYKMRLTADDTMAQGLSECWVYVRTGGPGVIIKQSAGSTDVTEGGATDTYTVKLNSEPTGNVTVTLSPDADVTVSPTTLTFTPLNFDQTQTVTVTAFDDLIDEGAHTGTVTHSATSTDPLYDGIAIADVVANITDDDSPGIIALKSSSYGIGETGPTVTLLVSRTGGTAGAASVNFATTDITATGDVDYASSSGTLNWADDDSADKSIVITINDDLDPETNETFSVTISGITGAALGSTTTATVTISDDDEPGVIALANSAFTVSEADGSVSITLTRTGGNAGEATVDYSTLGQSATADSDFGSAAGTVTWPAGDDTDKTVVIGIVDDVLPEGDETFDVMLSNANVAALGSPTTATVTITDNDFGPGDITGLVGWYDAQSIADLSGTSITTWPDTLAGSNSVANDLTHETSARKLTAVAPTVQAVTVNGAPFKSVRFLAGAADEYELLKATGMTAAGDASRSLFVVYKGGADDTASRPVSFGSINAGSNKAQAKVWGLATDGNGSMRFEGTGAGFSVTGYAAGLDRAQFVLRTAVMESINSFDEYIDVLDGNYTETQVLSNGNPRASNKDIGATEGDFFIGDSAAGSEGGGSGASTFDVLEVIVYDKILSAVERGQVQTYLKNKYCGAPDIEVSGNGVAIPNGDTTPETADDTDFGDVATGATKDVTFTISNLGTSNLTLPSLVSISGGEFTVFSQPSTPVLPSLTTTFVVRFAPTSGGVQTATISIESNDTTNSTYTFQIQGNGTGNGIPPHAFPAGISLYGYTGEADIDAEVAFQPLISSTELSLIRWVDPANGNIKELYYTTFPSPAWVNEIGNLTLGQGYVVKVSQACSLTVDGNKSTASVSMNLPAGYSILGYNKETPMDVEVAFQALISAGKLDLVRWVDPANGQIKELYYTTYPSPAWINEIGSLVEGQGYILKLKTAHPNFTLP